MAKRNQFKEGSSERLLGASDFLVCLVWNVVCVVGGVRGGGGELVEFVWTCVAHEHNDVCKQKGHGRRVSVEGRSYGILSMDKSMDFLLKYLFL